MPKPIKKRAAPKPQSDPNEAAFDLVRRSTELHETPSPAKDFKAELKAYMAKIGAKGGKVSGAKRMTNLTDKQRKDVAKKAAAARWKNRKEVVTKT